MRTLSICTAVALSSLLFVSAQTDKWHQLRSTEWGYEIQFPAKPELTTQQVKSEIGKLKMNIQMYDASSSKKKDENLVYMVNVTDYPADAVHSDMKDQLSTFFDGAVKGAVSNVGGKLLSQKEVIFEGYPGREIKVDFQNGMAIITMRSILVKNRNYIIQTICETDKDGNKSMTKFFNSFKLLK